MFLVLISVLLNVGNPQCYPLEEISTQMSSHEELDLVANMGDLLSNLIEDLLKTRERMAVCNGKTCLAPLQTCLDTNSLVRTDRLESYLKE